MAKHVIYGAFGFAAAAVIAVAIYIDKPALDAGAEALGEQLVDVESQRASALAAEVTGELYEVLKVIDGDTISIKINEKTEIVRLIGIDAPETGTSGACFAAEATNALKTALHSKRVNLEKDHTQGERDKYDRLLAYVFTESGTHIGEYLVREGFAREYTYNKSYKYQTAFKAAQKSAQDSKKGLWASVCTKPAPATQTVVEENSTPPQVKKTEQTEPALAPVPEQVQSPAPPAQTEAAPPPASSSYTCSSNTYNCSDFTTQAEAQAVFDMCGGVGNDIHRLDSNKDGEACESLP